MGRTAEGVSEDAPLFFYPSWMVDLKFEQLVNLNVICT